MDVERKGKQIDIYLTADEVCEIQSGKTVGDRPSVTMPDAKVEILPLSAVEPDDWKEHRYADDRLGRAVATPLKGKLLPNGDLQIIIPGIKLSDVLVSGARISRDQIQTPMTQERDEALINHVIPEDGVIVHFGGSMQVIDISKCLG